jgi:tellurite resistance protein TerC
VKRFTQPGRRAARRLLIGLAGTAILVLGLLFIVTPGPAFLVIPAGLGVLALEFETPRRWREQLAAWARAQRNRIS